jgi:symplekin
VHTFDEHLRAHILNEQKTRGDLALLWMQEMFVVYQTTPLSDAAASADAFAAYDSCLCKLLNELYQKGEHKETLFHKLLLEAPAVTPSALVILKQACMDAVYYRFAMETLKEMITSRPRQRAELIRCGYCDMLTLERIDCFSVLLAFACCERSDVRNAALDVSRELYAKSHCRRELKEFVLVHAAYLATDEQPPQVLFGVDMGRPGLCSFYLFQSAKFAETKSEWDEGLVKACVCLLLHLAPTDASLMLALADIYARAPMIVKRTLLKLVEVPVKAISGDARQYRELLTVIELCPVGAETLATRIVHLLTERSKALQSCFCIKHLCV